MNITKPFASLSLDLDNQWSYMKTHGETGWESFPSYLDILVPRLLSFLEERGLKITVFIVGQDAALEKNREALSLISPAGHEVGNHSFNHEPWLHIFSREEIEAEIASAEEHIERSTGMRPIGFRGPGFSLSSNVLQVLARRGYLYDASTLPTFLGPLARAYYLMTARLNKEEKERRKALFGTLRDGLRPLKPYRWKMGGEGLIEIPVTTMPGLRVPFHLSYILYLNEFSPFLAMMYFRNCINLCKWLNVQPSVLLHPLDFLGCDDLKELSFFPGMKLTSGKKIEVVSKALEILAAHFTVQPLHRHAKAVAETSNLPFVPPVFKEQEQSLVEGF